jgi:hypothetical protein
LRKLHCFKSFNSEADVRSTEDLYVHGYLFPVFQVPDYVEN